jgi:Holliday junction resolvase RusA-like endonuclease
MTDTPTPTTIQPVVPKPFLAEALAIMAPTAKGLPQKAERIDITVEGEPQVQIRTAMTYRGGLHMYDPSSLPKSKFRLAVRESLSDGLRFQNYPLFTGPVEITVSFYVSNMRKDVDNLLKFVFDALQTLVYLDDKTVHKVIATKHHSPLRGYTTISVQACHAVHIIE